MIVAELAPPVSVALIVISTAVVGVNGIKSSPLVFGPLDEVSPVIISEVVVSMGVVPSFDNRYSSFSVPLPKIAKSSEKKPIALRSFSFIT